jgi:polyisoprenoid-binding protein YceI
MKQYLIAGLALSVLAACGPAANEATTTAAAAPVEVVVPAGMYALDPTHASVTWTVKHLGVGDYSGFLGGLEGTATLDPANPAASSIQVTIDPKSVITPYRGDYKATHADSPFATFDEAVARDARFLNADAHSAITFVSTAVAPEADGSAKVTGDLTFLGVTKPVTLDVTLAGQAAEHPFSKQPAIGFTATGSIKRSDFGMTAVPTAIIGDDVAIVFSGEFQRAPDAPAAQ